MQKNISFIETKNKPRFLGAFGVFKKSKFILHESGISSLKNKQFRKISIVNKKHRIFRMRDGPPAETGPPKTGPPNTEVRSNGANSTGPPMEWLVLKQTRARE